MKVMLITEIEQLEPLEQSYNDLLKRVGGLECLYYSLDYLRSSEPFFNTLGASIFFIVVLDAGSIKAVLPFQRKTPASFCSPTTITFWGEFYIYPLNIYQKILADGPQLEAIEQAADFLMSNLRGEWDRISFSRVKMEDDNIRHFASRLPGSQVVPNEDVYYYFANDTELDTRLGSTKRRKIRSRRRRISEDFETVEIREQDHISPTDLDELMKLHTQRQVEKDNGGAFFDRPLECAYVKELFRLWNERGCVRYYSMRVDDQLAAFHLLFNSERVSSGFIMAFDSRFNEYSPLRTLTYDAYKREFEHLGTIRIESGWGTNLMKRDFSSGSYPLFDVEVTGPRVRSKAIHLALELRDRLPKGAVARLQPLKKAVGRLVRR